MPQTPAALGYRMPAEWEPHEATWIAWPHNRSDWPGKFAAIPFVFAEIVRHLHTGERVHILVNTAAAEKQAQAVLTKAGVDLNQIRFFHFPTNRVWTRDYGPIFVSDGKGKLGITDWRFNAWAKYPDWQKDDAVPSKVQKTLKCPAWQPKVGRQRVVLEGGSIDVNGQGLMLTTEECLLSEVQQRNPGLTREDLEKAFADYLGVSKVLWLGRGIAGDDTHGHIDDLARFVGPRTVVVASDTNRSDKNFLPLRENEDRLEEMTDLEGKKLEVVYLPMPLPVFWRGQRLPASYANFYVGNKTVLVPTFNDSKDIWALSTLQTLFHDRTVVGIHAVDLVWGLGTLHCLTQQQPKG